MKQFFFLLMIACAINSYSYGQLRTPAPSPTQTIRQDFGVSNIEISYSRPGVKGRKIFGDVVPFDKIWRTGANQATTIQFGDEVTIGGVKVPAGKYGLLTIPAKENWTVIITRQLDVTGPDAYKQDSDVVRVQAKAMALKDTVETFTMQLSSFTSKSCELHIMWEMTHLSLPITTDIDPKVMAMINEAMSGTNPPYYEAASYYLDNGKDVTKAKEWAQKAADADPKAYYVMHLLAKIYAKSGDKANALTAAKKSIELSKEAKNADYVKLNEKLIAGLK